jgi:hypothetical protein
MSLTECVTPRFAGRRHGGGYSLDVDFAARLGLVTGLRVRRKIFRVEPDESARTYENHSKRL